MKKRGFTLVELLATILILAVIALITIPIVINVIDDAQKSKFKQNAKSLLNLVKLERDNKNMMGDNEIAVYNIDSSYGNVFFNEELIEEDFNGEIDGSGIIIVNKDGDMAISYSNGKWCAYKTYEDTNVNITKGDCGISSKLSCEDLGLEIVPENSWSQYKTVKINSNNVTCKETKYKINDGELKELTEDLFIEENNTNLSVYTKSIYDVEKEESFVIDKIDRTPPEKVILSAIPGTNSVKLNIDAVDSESGIEKYIFNITSADNSNYKLDSDYNLTDLKPGTYHIKVKAYNGTYGSIGAIEELGATESNEITVVIPKCQSPIVTMNPLFDVYGQAKLLTIDYGNDNKCTGSYSIDNGATWVEGNKVVLYQPGTKLIAKNIENETNETNTVTYDIDTIDRTAPTEVKVASSSVTPTTLTVVATATDPESGIYGYKFSNDGGITYSDLQTSNIYTFTGLENESYDVRIKAYNNAWYNTKDLVLDDGERVEREDLGASESEIKTIYLASCPAPSINVSPDGDVWKKNKTVTITYDRTNECPVKKYSFDGKNWEELASGTYSVSRTLTENANVASYQGVTDARGTNYQKYIEKIDPVVPQASFSVTTGTNYYYSTILRMNLGCNAGASGITKYTVTVAGSPRNVNASNVTYTLTEVDGKEVVTSTASGTDSFYPRSYSSTTRWMNISVTCTNGAGETSPAQTTSIYYIRPTDTPTNTPTNTPTPTPSCITTCQQEGSSAASSCASSCSANMGVGCSSNTCTNAYNSAYESCMSRLNCSDSSGSSTSESGKTCSGNCVNGTVYVSCSDGTSYSSGSCSSGSTPTPSCGSCNTSCLSCGAGSCPGSSTVHFSTDSCGCLVFSC